MNKFIKVSRDNLNDVVYINVNQIVAIAPTYSQKNGAKVWMSNGTEYVIRHPCYSELVCMLAELTPST